MPNELIDMVFALLGRNVYVPAARNRTALVRLAGVCRRWRNRLRPLLERTAACTTLAQVQRLTPSHVDRLTTLSIVLDTSGLLFRKKEARLELQRFGDLAKDIVTKCRSTLRSVELGTAGGCDDLGWLFHPRLRLALEALNLTRFSLAGSPPTSARETADGDEIPEDPPMQSKLDADVVFSLVAAWPALTSLVLDALLRAPSGCATGLAPPKCRLTSLWLHAWYEPGHGDHDTFEPVEWILSNSVGALREFRVSEAFFFSPLPSTSSPTTMSNTIATNNMNASDEDEGDEGGVPSLMELLDRHGRSLRSLDLGLFVCSDSHADHDDFCSLLIHCPSLTSYTHGDIVIDSNAVNLLANNNPGLRQLRIYYDAASKHASRFARHLADGRFRQLRTFHVVVDSEIDDADDDGFHGVDAIERVCSKRGIEFIRVQGRRW